MASIIFIKGAEPDAAIAVTREMEELLFYLRKENQVTLVGTINGCTLDDIINGVKRNPDAAIYFCWAHGQYLPTPETNPKTVSHTITLNTDLDGILHAAEVYRTIRRESAHKPLDVFMISCDPHDRLAMLQLANNTTVVSFANKYSGSVYAPDPVSYAIREKPNVPMGQDFLLSQLNRGYDFKDVNVHPTIFVIKQQNVQEYNLWELAAHSRLRGLGKKGFSGRATAEVTEMLIPHFHSLEIKRALDKLHTLRIELGWKNRRRIPNALLDSTQKEARDEGWFGAACAVAYCLSKAPRVAFSGSKAINPTLNRTSTLG